MLLPVRRDDRRVPIRLLLRFAIVGLKYQEVF